MRWSRLVIAAVVASVLLVPVAAVGSHDFVDVPDTDIFHANISWMAANGVTAGCNPPVNDEYCPNANVTRGQMAAFMQRLAQGEIVDAATALQADNADTLDGMDSTEFLSSGDVASDSALLGGVAVDDLRTLTFGTYFSGSPGSGYFGPLTSILSLDVEVPAAGSLVVAFSASAERDTGDTQFIVAPTLEANCGGLYPQAGGWGAVDSAHQWDNVSGSIVLPVEAGTNDLLLCGAFMSVDVILRAAQISAVFHPGGSAPPLPEVPTDASELFVE